MTRNDTDTVTRGEAIEAWREDHRNLSKAELAALTQEGSWLHDRMAGAFIRVTNEPPNDGAEDKRIVDTEDMSGRESEYRLDHFRSYITNGEIEPIPEAVVENADEIAAEVAAYELGKLNTLSRVSEYSVVAQTETFADAHNAVRIAQHSKTPGEKS